MRGAAKKAANPPKPREKTSGRLFLTPKDTAVAVGVALLDRSGRDSTEYVDYTRAVFQRRSLLIREGDEHGVREDVAPAEANNPQHAMVRNPRHEGKDCDLVADAWNSAA